ncbi:hypothetical protein NDU88_003062 [Pleurodeles waltl]|uniref:Uncharacterized protein n=1 Tax=Pleurodeles waltl TaxID=8319 RepID=A0AAV7P8J4_PLEWA|nr:hypothetical protein NDU88_003062 [Pleurodeles waltl]
MFSVPLSRLMITSVRSPEPEEEYPEGTPDGADTIPEEVGAHRRCDRNNDSETMGVLNPVWEEEGFSGDGDERRTECGTDEPVSEVETGRGLHGAEAPTTIEAEIMEDVCREGEAERLATFWEERGLFTFGLQPERDTGRREL